MKKISLIISVFLIIFTASVSFAQVSKVVLGVDGFTCSLCAKGVEGQLKDLDFVKSVKTDLKGASFTLTFKNQNINLDALKSAVVDGGFTVRSVSLTADGEIQGSSASGFTFVSSGIPSLPLKNVNGDFNSGDKVKLTGTLSSSNSINVKTIKKL